MTTQDSPVRSFAGDAILTSRGAALPRDLAVAGLAQGEGAGA